MTDLVPAEQFQVTPKGVVIKGKPSLDDAVGFATQMFDFIGVAPIVVADLYLYVKEVHGKDQANQLVPVIGRTKHTINNWVSIVTQFPMDRRVDGLHMGHYEAVTGIKFNDEAQSPDVGTQNKLLKRAAREQMPISRLREIAEQEKQSRIPKVIGNGEDPEPDDDKPVFDSSDTGEALAAERDEKRDGFESKSDANQILDNALSNVERACANSNRACLNRDRIDYSRVKAAIIALQDLLPRETRKPVEKPVTLKAPAPVAPPAPPVVTDDNLEIPKFLRRNPDGSLPKEKAGA